MDKPGSTTTNTLDLSDEEVMQGQSITRDVALGVDEVLTLRLPGTSGSTGYSWTADARIGDPTVVQQTSHEYLSPSLPPDSVGGSGTDVWTFMALKAGTTTIATDLRGPGGEEIVGSFKANVTVH